MRACPPPCTLWVHPVGARHGVPLRPFGTAIDGLGLAWALLRRPFGEMNEHKSRVWKGGRAAQFSATPP